MRTSTIRSTTPLVGALLATMLVMSTSAGCDSGDGTTDPGLPFPPPPTPDTGQPDTPDPVEDVVEDTGDVEDDADAGPPPDPSVTVMGPLEYFEQHPELAADGVDAYPAPGYVCSGSMRVLVAAANIPADERLYVMIEGANQFVPANILATPYSGPASAALDEDLYVFEMPTELLEKLDSYEPCAVVPDGSTDPVCPDGFLCTDGDCVPPLQLEGGDKVKLAAFIAPEGATEVPKSDPTRFDQINAVYDNEAPAAELTYPNPNQPIPTLSGATEITGSASDDKQMNYIEVAFQGEVLAQVPSASNEKLNQSVSTELDLRFSSTDPGDDLSGLRLVAYDACGHASEPVETDVKIVGWPFLRAPEEQVPPEEPIINDSTQADLTGDGFDDLVLATLDGIVISRNAGDGTFPPSGMTYLTDRQTVAVAVLDLDGVGGLDFAAVENAAGKLKLVIYRGFDPVEGSNLPVLFESESHELPTNSSFDITGMVATDLTGDALNGVPVRADIAISTRNQEFSLVLFKRANEDQPGEFDQCDPVTGRVDEDGNALPDTWDCPSLFSDSVISGGVEGITYLEARDVAGLTPDIAGNLPGPDGFVDLIVGSEGVNEVKVFVNRFQQVGLLDTAFTSAVANSVYPLKQQTTNNTRFLCTGNFIEEDIEGEDPMDMVVGTEKSGTWRVLRGRGGGVFDNNGTSESDVPHEVYTMSGTVNNNVLGLACGDLNGDGFEDFAIVTGTRLMQVHLGDGNGRFNQIDPDEPLLNPVNEGIGFVIKTEPKNLRFHDFDGDGLLDVYLDHGKNGFVVMRNTSNEDGNFDLDATRALVTPLGKVSGSTGGALRSFAVGDLNDDGLAEVVGFSPAGPYGNPGWIADYHPYGRQYRDWFMNGKNATGMGVFVWAAGTAPSKLSGQAVGATPSYPAAYDRFNPNIYWGSQAGGPGMVSADDVKLFDLFIAPEDPAFGWPTAKANSGGDGYVDLIASGEPIGNPRTGFVGLANVAPNGDFWDTALLTAGTGSMFMPFPASADVPSPIRGFSFVGFNPDSLSEPMPSVIVGFNNQNDQTCTPSQIPPMMKVCDWNTDKPNPDDDELGPEPFWDCRTACGEDLGKEIGGTAVDVAKVVASGTTEVGLPSEAPDKLGHALILNQLNGTLSIAEFDEETWGQASPDDLPQHPWFDTIEYSMGEEPQQMALGDIDGDGVTDVVVTLKSQVLVAFGLNFSDQDPDWEPGETIGFEAPTTLDDDASVTFKGGPRGIVLSDINSDGALDVAFNEFGQARVVIYLGVGPDPNGSQTRSFHGPIYAATCQQPTKLAAYDFDGDGCETLLSLCSGSGAIALIENDTCFENAAQQ